MTGSAAASTISAAAACAAQAVEAAWLSPSQEREIGEGGRMEFIAEDKIIWFFANNCQHGTMWHATSAFVACVTHLGHQIEHLTQFRDLDEQFESLVT